MNSMKRQKENIEEETKKYLETKKNENTVIQKSVGGSKSSSKV